jgi:hypothetical protein
MNYKARPPEADLQDRGKSFSPAIFIKQNASTGKQAVIMKPSIIKTWDRL